MKVSYQPVILYEDDSILVCQKPPGMATQSRRIGEMTVESHLKNHLAQSRPAGREPFLGVIHRLDQPVEGILVFALTSQTAASLNKQLQRNGFGKYYRAFTQGQPTQPEGYLKDYLTKDTKTNLSRISTPSDPAAKPASLFYQTVVQPPYYFAGSPSLPPGTELDIRLETGRHHQIRVQLAHLGCPICGDRKYGSSALFTGRLCLCAYRLEFLHPETGNPMVFSLLDG